MSGNFRECGTRYQVRRERQSPSRKVSPMGNKQGLPMDNQPMQPGAQVAPEQEQPKEIEFTVCKYADGTFAVDGQKMESLEDALAAVQQKLGDEQEAGMSVEEAFAGSFGKDPMDKSMAY